MISKNNISYIIKSLFNRPLETLLYHLSGLMPRNKQLWLFGAQKNEFSCNPKHFFLHASRDKENRAHCVWVSRDAKTVDNIKKMGFNAVKSGSPFGIWLCLRARYYFVNSSPKDVSFLLSKRAKIVNLWHGIPLKKIGHDNLRNKRTKRKQEETATKKKIDRILNPKLSFNYDLILSTSDFVTEYSFKSAFSVSDANCLPLGYPRTDIFYWPANAVEAHIHEYEPSLSKLKSWLSQYNQTILYAPTWRDTGEDFLTLSGIDFPHLDKKLQEDGSCMLLKMHPFTEIDSEFIRRFENIRVVDYRVDIYPLMYFVDTLITDYSSIYFDFLLLNRKIIFFCFDKDSYLSECRNLYFNYDDFTPGEKAKNYHDLCESIFSEENIFWQHERERVRNKFWGSYNGNAGMDLTKFISAL